MSPVVPPGRALSWKPRLKTHVLLVITAVFSLWLFTPSVWPELGGDARVFYAAGMVAGQGGNPYDLNQLFRMEDHLYNEPIHAVPGGRGYYHHAVYAYPPAFTRFLELFQGLGDRLFYFLVAGPLIVLFGIAGFEVLLRALNVDDRWTPRLFFLASTPMAMSVFVGNFSTLLLLSFAGALMLALRGRDVVGGVVLSASLLKIAVGMPVALALLVAGPGRPVRKLAGFVLGGAVFLGLNVVLARPGQMSLWVQSLLDVGGHLSHASSDTGPLTQTLLAGLPSLLFDHMPAPVAVAVCIPPVAAIAAWGLWSRGAVAARDLEPLLPLGIVLSCALVLSPYIHINDLVVTAMPALLLATGPLRLPQRIALVAWFVIVPVRLFVTIPIWLMTGQNFVGTAGAEVINLVLNLIALAAAAGVGAAYLPRPQVPSVVSRHEEPNPTPA